MYSLDFFTNQSAKLCNGIISHLNVYHELGILKVQSFFMVTHCVFIVHYLIYILFRPVPPMCHYFPYIYRCRAKCFYPYVTVAFLLNK